MLVTSDCVMAFANCASVNDVLGITINGGQRSGVENCENQSDDCEFFVIAGCTSPSINNGWCHWVLSY